MNAPHDGGPAFPVPQQSFGNGIVLECKADGMSLRDWFAGMALAGLPIPYDGELDPQKFSRSAYDIADARKEDA